MSGGILWGEQAAIYGMFTASMVREPKATTSKGGGGGSEETNRRVLSRDAKGDLSAFQNGNYF